MDVGELTRLPIYQYWHTFTVCNPKKHNVHVYYKVTGTNTDGTVFKTWKRYTDFHLLYNIIIQRWPGVFV